jgi:pyruvate dehydrogenase E2 component (dihydrolipoamide acetyltransferase)
VSNKEIMVPNIGGFDAVEVIEIHVDIGDKVENESPLITLESDKASMDIPSTAAGKIHSMNVKIGDKISEGDLILILDSVEESEVEKESKEESEVAIESKVEQVSQVDSQPLQNYNLEKSNKNRQPAAEQEIISFSDAHASPSVRKTAREFGVNLKLVTGSGRKGRIVKSDVQAYVKEQLKSPSPGSQGLALPEMPKIDFGKFGPIEVKPMSRIQKKSSANLHRNWVTIPHVTQFEDADITETEAFRKQQKSLAVKNGYNLTLLPFIMKAVAYCLKQFPTINASLDVTQNQIIIKKHYHIGLAVDTDNGLVVVVVKDVDQKSVMRIAEEIQSLAEKARNGKLTPVDTQGGTFTISNLGGIGGTGFTPIINAPEVAILGVSKAQIKPVYQAESFVPRLIMPISFSYDHRVIDGALAVRFTTFFAKTLHDIRNIIL